MNENCEFDSHVELSLKNNMLAEHEIGEYFTCDDCTFKAKERSEIMKHIETHHGNEYQMCGGNCTDRLYEENSFTCGTCIAFLCTISQKQIQEKIVIWILPYHTAHRVLKNKMKKCENLAIMAHVHFIVLV